MHACSSCNFLYSANHLLDIWRQCSDRAIWFQHHNYANRWRELWLSTWKEFSIECVHMTSRDHVGGVNKETAAMLEKWILLGIELYFYAHFSFCFIMQIWLLVTWHSIRILAPKTFGNNIFLSEIDSCIYLVLYLFPGDENVRQG